MKPIGKSRAAANRPGGPDRRSDRFNRPRPDRFEKPRSPAPRREVRPIPLESLAPPEDLEAILAVWGDRAVEIAAKLTQYIKQLLETNQLFNITGDTAPEKQWRGHIEDALIVAAALELENGAPLAKVSIADVGSGGGMPGVVWAVVWPEAEVTLIEATAKKADFLRSVGQTLGLSNLTVLNERAETTGQIPALRENFDWVTARALAELPVAAEWTVPLCKVGGRVALIKGAEVESEMRAARRAFRVLGASPDPKTEPYTRSDSKSCNLLIYKKSERTPSPYPRRVGVATQNPL